MPTLSKSALLSGVAVVICVVTGPQVQAQQKVELKEKEVMDSIDLGVRYLISKQSKNGSFQMTEAGRNFEVGMTSLGLMSLINCGMTIQDPPVARALRFLRNAKFPDRNYEIALMIQALASAKDGQRDKATILQLARQLEKNQIRTGRNAGSWGYSTAIGGDRSNGQFAILGLREAAYAGVPVSRKVWELAESHWKSSQNSDGGWGYTGGPGGRSYGSMTVAGISTLVICEEMLAGGNDLTRDGDLDCCRVQPKNKHLEKAIAWMGKQIGSGRSNPGSSIWYLYYVYGMERAGRLSGQRFFGETDWYRQVASFLIGNNQQDKRTGSWTGVGGIETNPVLGTTLSLLFLSKGLAPVLINKLEYGPTGIIKREQIVSDDWNIHRNDVRNLTQHLTGRDHWPKLMTWQVLNIKKAQKLGGVEALLQAPVLYLTGTVAPSFTDAEVLLLREYINQGGFILAAGSCSIEFDRGVRDLVKRMYPKSEKEAENGDGAAENSSGFDITLKPLTADHDVFRSEYMLDQKEYPVEGADFGCRTAIILVPSHLQASGCWDKWAIQDPPNRTRETRLKIRDGMKIGVNIIAYATNREPPKKLDARTLLVKSDADDPIERGLLQVAKLRHNGGWDTAPLALNNLLIHLNRSFGPLTSKKTRELSAADKNLYKYPLLYMHGKNSFELTPEEQYALKKHLDNGAVLFADACCGSKNFDKGFRKLMKEMYPDSTLARIPVHRDVDKSHELFTRKIGFDIRTVKRRTLESERKDTTINTSVTTVQPYLEGIEIDGRLVVIYSKYDISCALQRQAVVACAGYLPDDATKIAINVVLYSLLQDITWRPEVLKPQPAE